MRSDASDGYRIRIWVAYRLAVLIADPPNPLLVAHRVVDILRTRMLAIACSTPTISIICAAIRLHASLWPSA
jgi:hypothetical protein